MQSIRDLADLAYPLTFAAILGVVAALVWALYIVGSLPGRIARDRGHPHATAISVCGWLGLPTLVLWPVALMLAYVPPKKNDHQHRQAFSDDDIKALALCGEEVDALVEDLREASQQVAAIKKRIALLSSSRKVA
jgi:Protein of unknown function (DUF3302)